MTKERDPDHGLHMLNMAWSLGFDRAVAGLPVRKCEDLFEGPWKGGPAAALRDQYYRGVVDGRALRDAMTAANNKRRSA